MIFKAYVREAPFNSLLLTIKNKDMQKTFLMIFLALCWMYSCKDTDLSPPTNDSNIEQHKEKGMERLVLGSSAEIEALLSEMNESGAIRARSVQDLGVLKSNNEELFVSLAEANRQKVMESLTPEQLDSIRNDDEDLEFCPSDSVIADIRFSQLLNANREIQVGDSIYKYFDNGVAISPSKGEAELQDLDIVISNIEVTDQNEGTRIKISQYVTFMPINYRYMEFVDERNDDFEGAIGGGSPSTGNQPEEEKEDVTLEFNSFGARLSNGEFIPNSDIRSVNFSERGDGNWLHYGWSKIWGRNVVALIRFNKRRQLNLNFYHQNYIVYTNTGTKLKMQKKVCGIWWNVKADTMIHGWETVTIQYALPKPFTPFILDNSLGDNPTVTTMHNYPFDDSSRMLVKIPFVNYNFTTKDLYKAFTSAAKAAFNAASNWAKSKAGSANNIGLMCQEGKNTYIIHGPFSRCVYNKRSIESKFDSKWFPGNWTFTFSFNDVFRLAKIAVPSNDGVDIYRGSVYGAIKYKGKWLVARIIKDT